MWVYFLAYNLIRLLMCQAAMQAEISPRPISFKHTLQVWIAWGRHPRDGPEHQQNTLFVLIAEQRVGNRPGRVEPRAVKRRPKPYSRLNLTLTCANSRSRILVGVSAIFLPDKVPM